MWPYNVTIDQLEGEIARLIEDKKQLQGRIRELEDFTLSLLKKNEFNVKPQVQVEAEKAEEEADRLNFTHDEDSLQDNYSRALRLASERQERPIVGEYPPQIEEEI